MFQYKRLAVDCIKYGGLVGLPLFCAVLTLLVQWCQLSGCKPIVRHFNQDTSQDNTLKVIVAPFMAMSFLIEAVKNVKFINHSYISSYPINQPSVNPLRSALDITDTSLDIEQPPQHIVYSNNHGYFLNKQRLSDLGVILYFIKALPKQLGLTWSCNIHNNRQIVFSQGSLLQTKENVHLLWKFFNILSDYWTISGASKQEKLALELVTMLSCWLRVYGIVSALSLQVTTARIQKKQPFLFPLDIAITKNIYVDLLCQQDNLLDKKQLIKDYNQCVPKMPQQLKAMLLCNVMLSTMAIMLPGLLGIYSSNVNKSTQLVLNSSQLLFPYIYCLAYMRDLEKQLVVSHNHDLNNQCFVQHYLPEIFSCIGTLQAVGLAYGNTQLAYWCVVGNSLINTSASIVDCYNKNQKNANFV